MSLTLKKNRDLKKIKQCPIPKIENLKFFCVNKDIY